MEVRPAIQISIHKPCTQNWEAMQVQQNGRFCDHCQHQVVDFTKMSDAALLAYVRKNGLGCGRFEEGQLDRIIKPVEISKRKYWPQVMLSIGLMLGIQKAQPQKVELPKIEVTPTLDTSAFRTNENVRSNVISIGGILTDQHGNPLANASIKVVEQKTREIIGSAVTDIDGKYLIKAIQAKFKNTRVLITFYSMESRSSVLLFLKDAVNVIDRRLVVSSDSWKGLYTITVDHRSRWQKIKGRVRRIFQ